MNIKYCPIEGGNFGDTLNTMVWDRLFPDLTLHKEDMLVYGIGTLLDGRHDQSRKKIVLGSGIGEAHAAMPDPNWDFRWVRGPLSAQEFGLSHELALGDPAVLWPALQAGHGGMVVISPRQSPDDVVAQLQGCSRVMAESLHGAICADAMAIPWAPCILAHRFNEFKWRDWLATVNRDFSPMVADRPLVKYKAHTRRPSLRAVAPATLADARQVSQALARYARQGSHFACSRPADVDRQRQRMLVACHAFANDYGLRFTP